VSVPVLAFPEKIQIGGTICAGVNLLSESADFDGDSLPFVHPCPTSTRAIRTCGL